MKNLRRFAVTFMFIGAALLLIGTTPLFIEKMHSLLAEGEILSALSNLGVVMFIIGIFSNVLWHESRGR